MAATTRRKSLLKQSLDNKLTRYTLAGSAVLMTPLASHAQITYSGILDDTVNLALPFSVNFPGSTTSFTLSAISTGSSEFNRQSILVGGQSINFVDTNSLPGALSFGSLISTANATGPGGKLLAFGTSPNGTGFKGGNWPQNHTPAYVGFAFTSSGQQFAGWAQASVNVDSFRGAPSATLIDYAYDTNPGESITAGQTGSATPEPSSLALFALGGAAALAGLRRRRAAAQQ